MLRIVKLSNYIIVYLVVLIKWDFKFFLKVMQDFDALSVGGWEFKWWLGKQMAGRKETFLKLQCFKVMSLSEFLYYYLPGALFNN